MVLESIDRLLDDLSLGEKVALLSGADFWHTRGIERLGIPPLKVTDGPHGARTMDDADPSLTLPATCFPTGVAMAATWNPDLVHRIGAAIGREAKERGCAILLGPCVNIHRSPLGGRNFESFSEDPYLSAQMAVAYIRGVQSQGIGACIKHFALNNSEYQRMTISSDADERTIREIYFPSFEKAVKEAGVRGVMCSYNKVNGIYASENRWLLTEVLKGEWGFNSLIISDWFAVRSTVPAAESGLDLEMPGPARFFGERLLEAVRRGEVEEKIIDDKVRRLLETIKSVGSHRSARARHLSPVPEHGRLALEAALEAIVLLKNEGGLLPLDADTLRTIAVIGPNAAVARIEGGGSSAVVPHYKVSPLEGIRRRCGDGIKIHHEPGCRNNILTPPLDKVDVRTKKGGRQQGLFGDYFSSDDFSGGPVMRRVETSFERRWLGRPPSLPVTVGRTFSLRWTGYFRARRSGTYRFGLVATDPARILVDNRLVCEVVESRPADDFVPLPEKTGLIYLHGRRSYPLVIEFRMADAAGRSMHLLRVGCEPPQPPDLLERAVRAAAGADVAIVFAGLSEEYESEGFDRRDMKLPGRQEDLIRRVATANPRTIVVLNNGSPLEMDNWIKEVPVVLEAWYPGQESGRAIAAVLFGDANPSGKLPDTFPHRLEDNPAFPNYPGENGHVRYAEGILVGYRYYDTKGIVPLFPFGHGLSYTEFAYSNLRVSPDRVRPGQVARVEIDVRNTGKRSGKEVVQLYLHDVSAECMRPAKELKAFRKIALEAGEKQTVSFLLGDEALKYFHPGRRKWLAEPGEFEVLVGSSLQDIRARASFTLLAD